MPSDYRTRQSAWTGDLILVAEAADTTVRSNLQVKSLLYARARIPEYWLDVSGRHVVCHRSPAENGDLDVQTAGKTILPVAGPDIGIALADLF